MGWVGPGMVVVGSQEGWSHNGRCQSTPYLRSGEIVDTLLDGCRVESLCGRVDIGVAIRWCW